MLGGWLPSYETTRVSDKDPGFLPGSNPDPGKRQQFLIKNHHKIYEQFLDRGLWIRDPHPDPVCPERLDPDQVYIRPDPKH